MERIAEFAQTNGVRYRATILVQDLRQKIQTQAPRDETSQIHSQLRRSMINRRTDHEQKRRSPSIQYKLLILISAILLSP